MTQTTPATCVLGPGKTGLTIGLRVLNLDGTEYAAFATTGVAETSVLGTYRKAGGVVCPAAGGYIVWGTALVDFAEATVEPAPLKPTTAGRTLEVAATGEASANVTLWKGSAPSDLINGNVTSHMIDLSGGGGAADAVPGLFTFGQSYYYNDGAKLSAEGRQNVADSLKLTPTAGAAAAGSVMDYLADTPANVWSYATRTLTQSSTSTTDSTAAGSIARRRGDSWSISLTIGAITGYTSLWFTAKWDRDNTDAQSVLQIKKNASGTDDGLLYVNGAAATDATKGSITVSDASTGAIVIAVDETITDDLPPAGIYYDVQVKVGDTVSTPDSGTLTISADVTRAVA